MRAHPGKSTNINMYSLCLGVSTKVRACRVIDVTVLLSVNFAVEDVGGVGEAHTS